MNALFKLKCPRLSDTLVIINLSLSDPWTLEDDLLYWSNVLEQHIKSLNVSIRIINS